MKFATGNEHKVREAREILEIKIERYKVDLEELQAITLEEVVEHKAKQAFELNNEPVIVEDTGLFFDAWNELPGALIRWFMETVDNAGISRMIKNFDNKKARAETIAAFWNGTELISGKGVMHGTVPEIPRGTQGFGWDSLFVPDGYSKTLAEMTPEEKNAISTRKHAFEELRKQM